MNKKKITGSYFKSFIILLSITFIIRLPYFFKADIDWDESTFLLLGQSVLDGSLPYTSLMDVKAPFLWYIFAGLIAISGKSLVAIRFFGAVVVAIISFINYLCVKKFWNNNQSLISAIVFIIIINLNSGGQAVLSEHLALIPLSLAFAMMIYFSNKFWGLYGIGFFITLSAMIRLNLAYTVLFISIYITLESIFKRGIKFKIRLLRIISYSLGCINIIAVAVFPYLITGNIYILYDKLIKTSLEYVDSRLAPIQVFSVQISYFNKIYQTSIALAIVTIIIFIALFININSLVRNIYNLKNGEKKYYLIIALFCLSIELSIINSGVFFPH